MRRQSEQLHAVATWGVDGKVSRTAPQWQEPSCVATCGAWGSADMRGISEGGIAFGLSAATDLFIGMTCFLPVSGTVGYSSTKEPLKKLQAVPS